MGARAAYLLGILLLLLNACGDDTTRKRPTSSGSSGDGSSEKCEPGIVCVRVKPASTGLMASIETFSGIELTFSLEMDLKNLNTSTALPLVMDLTPSKNIEVTTLTQANADAAFSYSYKYKYGWGRRNVTHDDSVEYRLPFETSTARSVIQGYSGSFTHKGNDAYAIDFAMPQGTKILAARDGTVLDFVESFSEGGVSDGLKDKANAVRIVHSDGTVASYLHLQPDGAEVERGESVKAGDLIGYSGNTGYSSEPHLHFEVSKRIDVDTKSTIGTVFRTSTGSKVTLTQGTAYTAVD